MLEGVLTKQSNQCRRKSKRKEVFLEDGEIPLDNNAAERTIRGFCIGKKNWIMIDTISGAKASAVLYSLVETAKANNLKPYEYFKYLLEQIPEHGEFEDRSYLEDLLPWSDKLPAECGSVLCFLQERHQSMAVGSDRDVRLYAAWNYDRARCLQASARDSVPGGSDHGHRCQLFPAERSHAPVEI